MTIVRKSPSGPRVVISTFDAIQIGAGPYAQSGDIRGTNNDTILAVRNAANTADLPLLSTDSSNAFDVGSASVPTTNVIASTTLLLSAASVRTDADFEINSDQLLTPTAGSLRFGFAAGSTPVTVAAMRDTADSADLILIQRNAVSVANYTAFGASNAGRTYLNGATCAILIAGANTVCQWSNTAETLIVPINFSGALSSISILDTASAVASVVGRPMTIEAQSVSGTGTPVGGNLGLEAGDGTANNASGGHAYLRGGTASGSGTRGNVALGSGVTGLNWQSMQGGYFIADGTAAPTGNPVGGGFLYVTAGGLFWRGSAGTVTPIAPA